MNERLERKPIVTIGLPFFNNEKTLLLAIKSVVNQTYKEWKLILINDGSTDGSLEIAQRVAEKDNRIILINDPINRGLIFRLNQLIDLANTVYLARMDADDMMLSNRIGEQIQYLRENPEVDLVDTAMYSIDENNNPVGRRGMEELKKQPRHILKHSHLNHATIIGKTEWFKNNKYDKDFLRAEDYELWCRTSSFSNFSRISIPLYIVREGSVSIKNYRLSMLTLRKIFNKYGYTVLSRRELWVEIQKTYLKEAIYSLAGFLKLQHFLTQRRNVSLSIIQIEEVKKAIVEIDKIEI